MKKSLFEILVPTVYEDTNKPVRTKHHKEWDKYVVGVAGGLTINAPSRGQWVDTENGDHFVERVIPVKIMCTEVCIRKIAQFTKEHYRQRAIMFYKLSDEVEIYGQESALNFDTNTQ